MEENIIVLIVVLGVAVLFGGLIFFFMTPVYSTFGIDISCNHTLGTFVDRYIKGTCGGSEWRFAQ